MRIATLEHAGRNTQIYSFIGQGTCYEGDEAVFTTYMDATADHCRQWYPTCDVPGICPLPPAWLDDTDAGSVDATPGSDAGKDASVLMDAATDARGDGAP